MCCDVTNHVKVTFAHIEGFIDETVESRVINNKSIRLKMNGLAKSMKTWALCGLVALNGLSTHAQSKGFTVLSKINGVSYKHVDKQKIQELTQNMVYPLADKIIVEGYDGELTDLVDDAIFLTCDKDCKGAEKLKMQLYMVLEKNHFNPVIAHSSEDYGNKYYKAKKDNRTTWVHIFEDDEEINVNIYSGTLDFEELFSGLLKGAKFSITWSNGMWESDDEKEPRSLRDCLIVIDEKIYPDLHTQKDAVHYMFEHNMNWDGSSQKMLRGKELRQKYPDTKKKTAFEFYTSKGKK